MDCPNALELRKMLDGEISDRRLARIEKHLDTCVQCSRLIGTLPSNTELGRSIRTRSVDRQHDDVIQQVMTRAQGIFEARKLSSCKPPSLGDTAQNSLEVTAALEPESRRYPFLTPPQLPDELGRLGKYRVLDVLGQGGMGVVFRAHDPALDRDVALKVLWMGHPISVEVRKRFAREAKVLASLDHENIVPVYSVEEEDQLPFFTMKLLKGQSLLQLLDERGSLNQVEVLRIGQQITSALVAAHAKGVIHRDIKPANIWIDEAKSALLIDFGLARMDDLDLTTSGAVFGTPRYMSPEQIQGSPVAEQSDLFSLGCVLYHAVSGTPPFGGASLPAVAQAITASECEDLNRISPRIDHKFAQVVHRLLRVEPEDRYATASALRNVLVDLDCAATEPPHEVESGPHPPQSMRTKQIGRWIGLTLLLLIGISVATAPMVRKYLFEQQGDESASQHRRSDKVPQSQRDFAEWVLASGGSVLVTDDFRSFERVDEAGKLPDRPGWLFKADLSQCPTVTVEDLKALTKCETLEILHLRNMALDDSVMSVVKRFPKLHNLDISQTFVTDECLASVPDLALQILHINGTATSDRGVQHIAGHPTLTHLFLQYTQVTNDGLLSLASIPNLQVLFVGHNRLDDEGVRHLKDASQLLELDLQATGVSDVGLKSLEPLTKLRKLVLIGTRVSRTGIERFKQAIPSCEVIWDGKMGD